MNLRKIKAFYQTIIPVAHCCFKEKKKVLISEVSPYQRIKEVPKKKSTLLYSVLYSFFFFLGYKLWESLCGGR